MSDEESIGRADTAPLDAVEIQRLETHYGHAVTRMIHEYDQRDRDFLMHITINGGLFAAAGFAIGGVTLAAPGSMLVAGAALTITGLIGVYSAKALIGSVDSFKYWQGLMNATLAGLEVAILPDAKYGLWCRNVKNSAHAADFIGPELQEALEHVEIVRSKKNLVGYRADLALTLKWVWAFIGVVGIILVASSFAAAGVPQVREFTSVMWPG